MEHDFPEICEFLPQFSRPGFHFFQLVFQFTVFSAQIIVLDENPVMDFRYTYKKAPRTSSQNGKSPRRYSLIRCAAV